MIEDYPQRLLQFFLLRRSILAQLIAAGNPTNMTQLPIDGAYG